MGYLYSFLKPSHAYYENWQELRRRRKLFWISTALMLPVMLLLCILMLPLCDLLATGAPLFIVLLAAMTGSVAMRMHLAHWPCPRCKPDLLIVDDMGMKQLPRRSGEVLFEIIMRRYETRSTVMTSNRPLEDWGKLIGDVPSATAILDRFLHHAAIVTITGKSYRLRNQAQSGDEESKPANAPTGSATKKKPKAGAEKPATEPVGACES